MNKYVRGAGGALVGTSKMLLLKLLKGSNVKIELPALISINTEVSIDKGGVLIIGRGISMRSGSRIAVRKKGKLIIGDSFYMNTGCIITAHDSVTIGSNVEFGPGVLVYDQDHDFRTLGGLKNHKFKTSPVIIGNNVWVGANTIILRGTTIGDNCVIGAGSIIKGDYPPNKVIVKKRKTEVL